MNTGEDTQGLRKILDFTRLLSLFILSVHFYISCYAAFRGWGRTAEITGRIIENIAKTGLFTGILKPKLAGLLFLCISLFGARGKKDEKIQKLSIACYLLCGLLVYLLSPLVFYLPISIPLIAGLYMALSAIGYLLILTGGNWLSRLIKNNLSTDVFNSDNETFPQEERLLENEHSFNLPTKYNLKGKIRKRLDQLCESLSECFGSWQWGSGQNIFCHPAHSGSADQKGLLRIPIRLGVPLKVATGFHPSWPSFSAYIGSSPLLVKYTPLQKIVFLEVFKQLKKIDLHQLIF